MGVDTQFRLTSREICNIIKAGGESGLKQLSYQGLTLEFTDSPGTAMPAFDETTTQLGNVIEDASPQLKFKAITDEAETDTQAFIDQLVVDDPVEWERRINEADDAKARLRGVE